MGNSLGQCSDPKIFFSNNYFLKNCFFSGQTTKQPTAEMA